MNVSVRFWELLLIQLSDVKLKMTNDSRRKLLDEPAITQDNHHPGTKRVKMLSTGQPGQVVVAVFLFLIKQVHSSQVISTSTPSKTPE